MSRFDWRRLPPQILLAIVTTLVVVPVVAWDQLRSDSPSIDSDVASQPSEDAGDPADENVPAPSTTVLAIQPGWLPKGSSRYGDNGSGGDALPIVTTPVPRNETGATTTIPPRVKDPKSTTTTSTKPKQAPAATSPAATTPPPVVTSPPPPTPTEPPPVVTAPPTVPPTTATPPQGATGTPLATGAAGAGGASP